MNIFDYLMNIFDYLSRGETAAEQQQRPIWSQDVQDVQDVHTLAIFQMFTLSYSL